MLLAQPSTASDVAPDRKPRVRFVDPTEESSWDADLAKFDGATFFHTAGWCHVLKDCYGFNPCYAVAEVDGTAVGLLALMEVNNWPKGRRGISLPFSDHCDILDGQGGVAESLRESVLDRARSRGWNYVECRGPGLFPNANPSLSFHRHRLQLDTNENAVFDGFGASVQRAIRKAERSALVVEVAGGTEAVSAFYRLHCRTRQKHGVPPQPFRFFEILHQRVLQRDKGFVVTARLGKRIVASAIFCWFGAKAVYKFGASDERFQHLRGNNLVFWEAIRRLVRAGIVELDFGRTSLDNDGLSRFKTGWGALESRLEYRRFCMRDQRFVQDVDRASGWQNRLFSLVPRAAARCAGTLVYARLA